MILKSRKIPSKAIATALAAAALSCGPDVTVNVKPYEPGTGGTAGQSGSQSGEGGESSAVCSVAPSNCESRSVVFRDPQQGSDTQDVEGVSYHLDGVRDRGNTKTATFLVSACGQEYEYEFNVGQEQTLVVEDALHVVSARPIEYDEIGLKVTLDVTPLCE